MNLISDLGAATSVLGWDQETYMPDGAVAGRAEQMATLSSFIHSHTVGAESIELVRNVKQELDSLSVRQRLVAETFIRDHERSLKLPADLVNDQARTASMAQDAWKRSRQASDFSIFQPLLERTVELKRREAEIIGPAQHIYDNLLDSFEPGLTVATITPVFDRLRTGTIALLSELEPKQTSVHDDVLYRMYNGDQQVTFASSIIKKLGFNFQTGRVDISAHPFCTSFGSTDVRLTTRIRPNDLRSCLFGLIHEAGHGMYEQGISPELARTFSGQGASMGIHESQSLFWENIIARSEEFWHWAFPQLRDAFPDQLKDQDARSFYCAINKIKPSLNRVESDELTYNLHIILRFEIERDLIEGVLEVRDIPKVWNEKMEAALGVV
ncbi:MAG: carboxypeptidase M32, partial [Candidatus Kapabacteria bacterium]|nr:carboxypeptidase M32 [Candidatus Kapabacteria bacterium]